MPRRLKVLVSAYSCEPNKGSEQGVGWNWVSQMARFHEVWVITRAKRRPAIEKYLTNCPNPNIHAAYCDLPRWLRFWKSGERGIQLYYALWQCLAFLRARRLVSREGINLAHHVSLMSLPRGTFVSFLGIPSIIGPIGGLQVVPRECMPLIRHRLRERFRSFMVRLARYNPILRCALNNASRIILANGSNAQLLPQQLRHKIMTGFQIGTSRVPQPPLREDGSATQAFVVHWSGRLVDHKGFELALLAASCLRRLPGVTPERLHFVVTGAGPEKAYYDRCAKDLQVSDFFRFTGWLSQQELEAIWDGTDVFLFTSLRETTGMALQEAMMRGIPTVVVDNGGPGEMVTDLSGFKIRPAPLDQMAEQAAAAIDELFRHPDKCRELGSTARRRAEELFDWEKVGDKMNEVYLQVCPGP